MNNTMFNPFDVTKAVDFTDQQIKDYWVDMPGGGGFKDLAKPLTPMPMLILGGKGSGKTHLMRYFSYPIQKIIFSEDIISGIRNAGYVGIYLRCGGLNAGRFKGKGQDNDKWDTVFSYYMDLWLAQITLDIILEAFSSNNELKDKEKQICIQIIELFDLVDFADPTNIIDMLKLFSKLQKEADVEINNCSRNRELNVIVRVTPGRLVFGIPKILASNLPSLKNVLFLYLIDEFENLSEEQQKYVNTLVRERIDPSSIKIGARLYGIKTFNTYNDEENREDSEFECLRLDEQLRKNDNYQLFAKRLVASRLAEGGYASYLMGDNESISKFLTASFEIIPSSKFHTIETEFIKEKYKDKERPYFSSLRKKLSNLKGDKAIKTDSDIDVVITNLSCFDYPLLEKVNTLLLYKEWRSSTDLIEESKLIRDGCTKFILTEITGRYSDQYDHFSNDLLAQLLRECDQKQRYLGIDQFIDMSQGLPRNLIVILKNIFKWAAFMGENPFAGKPISIGAQREGLMESANWFFRDAKATGIFGQYIRDGVERLAILFREVRFSDKPSEKSLISFSTDLSRVPEDVQNVIKLAVQWSLLIHLGEQRHRNTKRMDPKYQLNSMLAPRWDLPIYRGGTIDLSSEELKAIFGGNHDDFEQIIKRRKERMNVPFRLKVKVQPANQQSLFQGEYDD